jgi:membrane protein DedA with SNARE-associated domain
VVTAGVAALMPYVGVCTAAMVEGEVAYVIAATLVGRGYLDPLAVLVAGAAGAAAGDQFYFYLLRGRLRRWLDRFDAIARRGHRLAARVQRHQVPMVLLIRFAPGLRIALAAACAYAGVSPLRFTLLNLVSAVCWAVVLLVVVAWLGPMYLPALGISGWWSALVPPLVIVIVFRLVSRAERDVLEDAPGRPGEQ